MALASYLPGECKLTLVSEWLRGDCKEVVDSTNDEPLEAENEQEQNAAAENVPSQDAAADQGEVQEAM